MSDVPLEPGLYRNLDFETYRRIPLPNSGAIKWGMVSMAHMKAAVDGRLADKDSTALRFGRAAHCIVLEPEHFESRFQIATPCQAVLKTGERKGEQCGKSATWLSSDSWFCGVHAPQDAHTPEDFLTDDERQAVQSMRDSLHENQILQRVRKPGWSEVTTIFDWLGVRWKGRIDRLPEDYSIAFDVKSCEVGKATEEAMKASIKEYAFHRQMVLYLYGVALLEKTQPDGAWVFVEKSEPYGVNILHIDHQTMSVAEAEIEAVAKRWRKACETGVYPCYLSEPSDVKRGGLPEWYLRKKIQEQGLSA